MATELKHEENCLYGKIARLKQESAMKDVETGTVLLRLQEDLDEALKYGQHPENLAISMDRVRAAMNRITKLRGYLEE